MRIKFENTPEQVELIKALGSSSRQQALEAQDAFAAFVGPIIEEVLLQAGTATQIYEDMRYDEDDSPSIPVDLYYGENEGTISVWQQTVGGGLPTNQVGGFREIKVSTYPLDSAISFDKRYVRRARLDVVARGLERMANEVLTKQERNAWYVILKALADTPSHVKQATNDNIFQVSDVNKLLTLIKRLNSSYNGMTPIGAEGRGLTDLYISPEMMAEVRSFSYQPMNTRSGAVASNGATSVALPDDVRSAIFNSAGASSIWNVNLNELLELGVGAKYNTLFGELAGSTSFDGATFTAASDEIIIGIDRSRRAFVRPIAENTENGGTFTVKPDDQFVTRSNRVGFYGGLEEGRVILGVDALIGLIV
jgi:hypothetical protein